jgi:hypothetical protein
MGTGSFPGVKQSGRGVDHPPHLAPRPKSGAILPLHLWAFVTCSRVNLPLPHSTMLHVLIPKETPSGNSYDIFKNTTVLKVSHYAL